ncbi:uncharacterized protein G2W53_021999 [Senna tora]|uniref:Uncharacterized protein n=1 Tax=Senna tora TaxID=362788 RepID=A0A834TNK8_9FABA|nr:uncharacterized protein G2W53_021999 [Senna tora]
MSVRVVFANRSGFDAGIGFVKTWDERGSCLNIFWTTNRDRISENFTNFEAQDLLRNGFDVPIGVVKAWEDFGSYLNILWTSGWITKTFTNYEAKDLLRKVDLMLELDSSRHGRSVDHVLTYSRRQIASGFDAGIGVVKAWAEHGSCLNIFRMPNRGRILENFMNYEAKNLLGKHGRSVDHVLTYSERQIAVGGFDAGIGFVKTWEERGSCLNIFQLTIRGQIPKIFTNYEAKDLLRKHGRIVDHVLTYLRREIVVASQEPSQIMRQKTCCAKDYPKKLEFNKSEKEVKSHFEVSEHNEYVESVVDHVLTYSGRQIAIGSQKPSRITRQKTCCASMAEAWIMSSHIADDKSQSDLRNLHELRGKRLVPQRSGFDAGIGVVKAWEEHGSCLKIFRMKNQDRISETFTNYEAKDLLRKLGRSMDHVLTYSGRQSRSDLKTLQELRGKRLVPQAWEERGSRLNIFRTTKRGRIIETFTNYEAKDLLRKMINHGWISETFTNYEAKDLLCNCQGMGEASVMSCHISDDKSRSDLRKLYELRGKRLVVESGFDVPIGVVKAWEERRSYINIFWMINRGRISETFTNYEAKDLLRMYGRSVDHVFTYPDDKLWSDLRKLHELQGMGGAWIMSYKISDDKSRSVLRNLQESRGKRLDAQMSETRRFVLYLRTGVHLMLELESSRHGRSVDHVLTYSGR